MGALTKVCRGVFWIYAALAVLSLALVLASQLRLFGAEPDPLSGIFAILLAQPWASLTVFYASDSDIWINVAMIAGGLVLNAAILRLLCGMVRQRA